MDISFRAGQSGGYCDLTTSMTQEQRRRGCITSHQSSRRCAEDINVSCFRAPSQQNTHFCCRAELQVCFLMPCVNFGLGVLFISGSRLVCVAMFTIQFLLYQGFLIRDRENGPFSVHPFSVSGCPTLRAICGGGAYSSAYIEQRRVYSLNKPPLTAEPHREPTRTQREHANSTR